VNVVGPPGIGKSRIAREVAALAAARGVEVTWAFCESHSKEIPFGLVAQLLRATTGASGLHGDAARARARQRWSKADPQDLLLLEDLLGIADPEIALPQIDPDARRRRITSLINTATLTRTSPALFIVEDAHWIDPGERVDVGRLPLSRIAHPVDGAHHGQARIWGDAEAGARRPNHSACATG
jgi:predicted ATPase